MRSGQASPKPRAMIQRGPCRSTSVPTRGPRKEGRMMQRNSRPEPVEVKENRAAARRGRVESKEVKRVAET